MGFEFRNLDLSYIDLCSLNTEKMKPYIAVFGIVSALLLVSISLALVPLHQAAAAMNQTMNSGNASNSSVSSNSTSNQTLSSNSTANATDGDIIGAGRRK
jgi:hypothetical protein